MNLRPPGYEPGELPDCSTPRRGPDCSTLVTIIRMWNWAIWGALIVAFLVAIAAAVLLAKRTLTAWRDFNDTRRDLVRRLDQLAASAEETADKAAAVGEDTAELHESLGRLRVSLAKLAVLRAALDEAEITFGRVAAVVPRK